MQHDPWDVTIVGGGIAGLTAAATAAQAGASALLLDSHNPGGRASTDRVGRFLFNRGGHALYRDGAGRPVLDRLGITASGAPPQETDAHARLGDHIGLMPWGSDALARTDLLDEADKPGLADALAAIPTWRPEQLAGRTAAAWFDELDLGPSARLFLEAQTRLTSYIVDLDRVSADIVATQLQRDPVVDYLHGGWASLVAQVTRVAESHGATIAPGRKVRQVIPDGSGSRIVTDDGEIQSRQVVLAAGTPGANAALLPERPAAWDNLGPEATAAALDLGLPQPTGRRFVQGFDLPLYLSRHAPAAELGPPGTSVVHLFRYLGAGERLTAAETRRELMHHAQLAGISPEDIEESRYLHRMTVTGPLPLPERGGMAGRPRITDTGIDGVLVAGDWVGPYGHLVDASLASGEAAGQTAAAAAAAPAPVTFAAN